MIRADFSTPKKICQCLASSSFAHIFLVVSLLVLLFLAGCKTTGSGLSGPDSSSAPQLPQYQKIAGGGWISIFLNFKQPQGPEISFEITSVDLQTNEQEHSLLFEPLKISSKSIGNGQLFIARNSVPANNYGNLKIGIRNVSIAGRSQNVATDSNDMIVELKLPSLLNVREGDSHSLFVTWDVFSSIDERGGFSPEMKVSLQASPFLSDTLYVACPELDTIYIIRTDKNWVISSLGVEGGPTYLALDQDSERLYVLTPGKSSIQVIDLDTKKIIDNIFIPFDYPPSFMTVSPDKRFAYVLDEQGRSLVSVELLSGAVINRITLSFEPRYAVLLEWQNKLAVSAIDTNAVYLYDPDSLLNIGMISVGSSPEGLLGWNNFLFVAESDENLVTRYDPNTNQQMERMNVGFSPRRLLLRNNQLYVSNFGSSSVTFMIPGQLNISGEIFLKGKPLELESTESRLWIYAGDAVRGGLHVIDSISNRLNSFIHLQALPAGLAVID
jgi:hypothetical protein